mmetsp:Transcript_27051/g.87380  ORF Transcript_27051/g.87380 Transcript_27051/m.87380 type:complete len:218 (+) Transcript_27051:1545-2198(+)
MVATAGVTVKGQAGGASSPLPSPPSSPPASPTCIRDAMSKHSLTVPSARVARRAEVRRPSSGGSYKPHRSAAGSGPWLVNRTVFLVGAEPCGAGGQVMVGGLVRMDNPSVASCSVIGQPTTPQTSGALKLGSPSTRMCNVSSYWPHWFECSTTASNAEPHGGISPSAGSTSYAAPSPRASSAASRLCSAFCAATLTPDSEKKGCELSCLSPSAGDGS